MAASNEQQREGGSLSASSASQEGDFRQLFTKEQRFPPELEVLAAANVKDYQALYDEAARDLEGFWEKIAQGFSWAKPWRRVLEGQAPSARW